MQYIEAAQNNVFKLIFSKGESDNILVDKTGRICVNNNIIHLDYGKNIDTIGLIENTSVTIRTLHRNLLPLYVRVVGDEIWLSNDVSELLIQKEVVFVRLVEILLAAAGSEGIRSAFSHLIEGITLLMSSSRYRISFENGSPSIVWADINFEFHNNATKERFLDILIERYNKAYYNDADICLALSGGYDSRLDLAILAHLKRKVHCYHYTTSEHEEKLARLTAQCVAAPFCAIPSEQLILPGWDFLKQQGYLTRWDGFFAAGTLYSAGLYTRILKEHPNNSKLIMGFGELRGRMYEYSDSILEYWIEADERAFDKCIQFFPHKNQLLRSELKRRKDLIQNIVHAIQHKRIRSDIAMDITFGMFSRQGKLATRSTFLFENGMPFFSIDKEIRDYFMSLPQKDKEQDVLLKWVIKNLNPKLSNVPCVNSTMGFAERQFGFIGRVPLLSGLLSRFTTINKGYSQDWYRDADVIEIFEQIPEIKYIAGRTNGDKPRLYIAQICRFLKAVQDKKNVSFHIVE